MEMYYHLLDYERSQLPSIFRFTTSDYPFWYDQTVLIPERVVCSKLDTYVFMFN
jgi:hypothetical protein